MIDEAGATTRDAAPPGMVERIWLDWNRPLTAQAATWLLDRAERDGGLLSLDHVACVTPGRRAGRVLIEELLRLSQARGETIIPPRTLTPGVMVDALVVQTSSDDVAARATDFESELAWVKALVQQDAGTIDALGGASLRSGRADHEHDLDMLHALAGTIHRLYVELRGQRKRFADAQSAVEKLLPESEREQMRWAALEKIERSYHAALAECELIDAHADRERIAAEGDVPLDVELVLIGVTELNQVQRTLVARMIDRTTALIHAPEIHAGGFDALGCIVPSYWSAHEIHIDDAQIIVADQPADQAQAVIRTLARLSAGTPVDHITIGVEDSSLANHLELAAHWSHVHIHRAEGESLQRTGPYRLLAAVTDWLNQPRFAHFAALLRHPDLEAYLHRQLRHQQHDEIARSVGDWITLLDQYHERHLHEELTGYWLGRAEDQEQLRIVYDTVMALVQPLRSRGAKPLAEWAGPILSLLAEVYDSPLEGDESRQDDRAGNACSAICNVLSEIAEAHERLHPKATSHEAMRIALDRAADETLPTPPRSDQIETLGWLELHADPAPVLILMGVNDGTIPTHVTADPFLPNSLRATLGLIDNAHRYALDAYRLEAINRSRERFVMIAGRRAEGGEPLLPSRLLLACDREMLPRRVRMLSDEHLAKRWPAPIGMKPPASLSPFAEVPRPPSDPPTIDRMSVTSFKLYLRCPYRFWLERVLKLRAYDDTVVELDMMSFGSFVHAVLQRFGEDETIRDSADADEIQAFLHSALNDEARRAYGSSPMPAVRIQIERIKRRLDAFVPQQVQMRCEGWRIVHCELRLPETIALDLPDGDPMRITGIIDRIDRNEHTGAFRIIDYKTGNKPTTPIEAHHPAKTRRGEWVDLQLPLYRYLARQIDVTGEIEVGYFVLPRDPDACGLLTADWSEEEHDAAIEFARDVVRNVRAGAFWPPSDDEFRDDPFANICRANVFGRDDVGERQAGGGTE